jgi:HD-like signal output (HDOD) protein
MNAMGSAAGTPVTDAPLPSLNITVSRLLALYAREDHTPEAIVRLLEMDPAIAGRVLRLANSAYYGFGTRVNTLRRAVLLLGGVTVQAVALGANLLVAWGRERAPAEVAAVWIDSYLCAKGCRHLGLRLPPHSHRSPPDALFLTGLLHHIGKIWFLSINPLEYATALDENPSPAELARREEELFGWDHAQAGGALLEAWQIPEPIVAAVRHQHGDRLRAELRLDWCVLAAATAICQGAPVAPELEIPATLVDDVTDQLKRDRGEAEAFYQAIA